MSFFCRTFQQFKKHATQYQANKNNVKYMFGAVKGLTFRLNRDEMCYMGTL